MNIGETVYLGDGNYVHVDNIIVEAPSITNCFGTRIRLEGQLLSNNPRSKGYCDIDTVQEIYRTFKMTPEKVIYNNPATIVLWKDGTKTVVKCTKGDVYDPDVGLSMCVCKKLYGSKYHKFFKYYGSDDQEEKYLLSDLFAKVIDSVAKKAADDILGEMLTKGENE